MTGRFDPDRTLEAPHMADEALLACAVDRDLAPVADWRHVETCAVCRARADALADECLALSVALAAEADGRLSAPRLDRQAASIGRRLRGAAFPARVLRFPSPSTVLDAAKAARRRWVAAAAVAGLFVGLVAGRLLGPSVLGTSPADESMTAAPTLVASSSTGEVGLSTMALTDEALLIEVDAAMVAPRIEPLATLDAITPRAHEWPPGY
ncbi:MAG: hypothetical protein KJ066_15260 [Acidobacteria bacterium]|nr:hypothetical protein [Acidobacteriota bacterium]